MTKLITAEEARKMDELKESLNKIYNTLNKSIRKSALNGNNSITYLLQSGFRNYEVIADILYDELTEAGYSVTVSKSGYHLNSRLVDHTYPNNGITFDITWSAILYSKEMNENESETEK